MKLPTSLALAAVVAASFAGPAVAQYAPQGAVPDAVQVDHASGPSIPHWGYVPTAANVKKAAAAENPAVRNVAESVYAQLASGNLNRSKLTQDVNGAFPDSTQKLLSQRLVQLGTPALEVRSERTDASRDRFDLSFAICDQCGLSDGRSRGRRYRICSRAVEKWSAVVEPSLSP